MQKMSSSKNSSPVLGVVCAGVVSPDNDEHVLELGSAKVDVEDRVQEMCLSSGKRIIDKVSTNVFAVLPDVRDERQSSRFLQ